MLFLKKSSWQNNKISRHSSKKWTSLKMQINSQKPLINVLNCFIQLSSLRYILKWSISHALSCNSFTAMKIQKYYLWFLKDARKCSLSVGQWEGVRIIIKYEMKTICPRGFKRSIKCGEIFHANFFLSCPF